ncbi:type I-MYXAN CRISPR-associated endonuclease Cas4/Cas1 [Chondromyces crocatus]|uniref:CRISPR-associated endonuclease Cas1 n=1 Tax=Chondromyces crocatus TaxID=52 RepID=A0A0K1EJT2_CHOCO|nr:type I-MYXAN CRISPR-associated endonuclease Cas4/Cas1 [Chondromyces crocatus]AKT41104.1 CRISPR-associated protein Cas1 [Chondromyces crocatus]
METETAAPTLRVMSLHALVYCERLFYLEEVEELRVADEAVWEGRRLHVELDEPADVVEMTLESQALGLRGRMDAVRRRSGALYPIEHKRGRCRRGPGEIPAAWPTDVVQAAAYAMLLEEHTGAEVEEARVRYHKDNVTVRVPITDGERALVASYVARARYLTTTTERPPVTDDERKCVRCSLAPVCLPEEARFAEATGPETSPEHPSAPTPVRLYPPDTERRSLHVVSHGARVGRSGDCFQVVDRDAGRTRVGVREVSDIVLHGHAQITTQALRLCAAEEIPVHFVTASGAHVGMFAMGPGGVQRRIRQYRGLTDDGFTLSLARRLILAKVEMQLRHLLRSSRKEAALRELIAGTIDLMRGCLRRAAHATTREELMGQEGNAARAYFQAIARLVSPDAGEAFLPNGRSRRPPEDRFNALLSFGYALLYRDVLSAIQRVGLEPAFGVLHQPRSAAFPLALDLTELFRVPVVDMAVLGAVNRRTFHAERDFTVTGRQVWLSDEGRRAMLEVYERRKHEEYRHDALGFSLSYARMMELEVRLLEKEWSGEGGLFARFRIR